MGKSEPHSKQIRKHSAYLLLQAHFDGLVLGKYFQKAVDFQSLCTQKMGMLHLFFRLKYILIKNNEKKYFEIFSGS